MKKKELNRLLRKALIFQLMTNIDHLIAKAEIPHSTLSVSTGQKHSWFNDAFNNNEDISISSLTKVLSVIGTKIDLTDYKLMDMFDRKVLMIARLITNLTDEEDDQIPFFICSEKEIIMDLLGDWGLLKAKKKLSENELETIEQIRSALANIIEEE
ncbi:hypothetical protein QYG89_15940 [Bacillus sp. B190/17]|uniref:XRE family transcriptional regulator n=1 Tax=Bacillus lumedeiriae TaxID=3058829 RepID=A0ABW8IC87_9BACI